MLKTPENGFSKADRCADRRGSQHGFGETKKAPPCGRKLVGILVAKGPGSDEPSMKTAIVFGSNYPQWKAVNWVANHALRENRPAAV